MGYSKDIPNSEHWTVFQSTEIQGNKNEDDILLN